MIRFVEINFETSRILLVLYVTQCNGIKVYVLATTLWSKEFNNYGFDCSQLSKNQSSIFGSRVMHSTRLQSINLYSTDK